MVTISYFSHKVGDGVYYINDRKDTSEGCILLNLEVVLVRNGTGVSLHTPWNETYPNDTMTPRDMGDILSSAVVFTERFDPGIPDNVADVLRDTRAMQCHDLADRAEALLRQRGVVF